jgi:hypothetical protein
MCQSCIEIDKRVERHRELLRSTTDPAEIERIKRRIAELHADRVRLHQNPERGCLGSRLKRPPPGFYLDRPFKPTTFLVVQPDGDRIFGVADEFEHSVVIVAENFMGKCFICTAHDDDVTVTTPADIDLVGRHAIEMCEHSLDSFSVDIVRIHL